MGEFCCRKFKNDTMLTKVKYFTLKDILFQPIMCGLIVIVRYRYFDTFVFKVYEAFMVVR